MTSKARAGGSRVFVERRGSSSGPSMLLLHGLNGNARVWENFDVVLRERWRGQRILVDLPGHGLSPDLETYTLGSMAAPLAFVLDERVDVVVGHSLGGVIGLALASGWFGRPPGLVVGLGIKSSWTDDELARAARSASFEHNWYPSETAAWERFLRISGLDGLVDRDQEMLRRSLANDGNLWRPTVDPRAASVGAPPMQSLLRAARSTVLLARGNEDPLVAPEDIGDGITILGAGHNAHIEAPEALWSALERRLP